MKNIFFPLACIFLLSFETCRPKESDQAGKPDLPDRFLVVLGIAQDAGYPQIGCEKACCRAFWLGKEDKKHVTCLALVDRTANQFWLFEATPDIGEQLHALQPYLSLRPDYTPDGIFITHAHIGHYSGLMQLGREAMSATDVPVWVMPRLDSFLRNNGPWSQLVKLDNIRLQHLRADSSVLLNASIRVTPFRVPHRDEFSETVGFKIETGHKRILFIPDIDKWEKWDRNSVAEIRKADLALLDGTFYRDGELPGRNMREVPHPFVEESVRQFSLLTDTGRARINFIHFNHTNPLLKKESAEKKKLKAAGFGVAEEGVVIAL